jgi:hypothetical protein
MLAACAVTLVKGLLIASASGGQLGIEAHGQEVGIVFYAGIKKAVDSRNDFFVAIFTDKRLQAGAILRSVHACTQLHVSRSSDPQRHRETYNVSYCLLNVFPQLRGDSIFNPERSDRLSRCPSAFAVVNSFHSVRNHSIQSANTRPPTSGSPSGPS